MFGFTPEQRKTAFISGEFAADEDSEQFPSLRGWWPLGVHGGNAKDWDYSGFKKHGTRTNGPTPKAVNHPRWGGVYALNLNGTTNYINCGDTPLWDVDYLTVTAWIYPRTSNTFDGVAARYDGDLSWSIYRRDSGSTMTYFARVGGVNKQHDGSLVFAANEWSHVAMVVDGTNLAGFRNGDSDGSIAASGTLEKINRDLLIGMRAPSDLPFDGFVNDVRFHNRAQSASLVNQIYNEPERLVYPLGVRTISFAPPAVGGVTSDWYYRQQERLCA